MTATLALDEWVRVLDGEYLGSFVADGGASVKFAVGADAAQVVDALAASAGPRGFVVLTADAAAVRVHMVDQLFFHLAGQVPWAGLARDRLWSLAEAGGYRADTSVGGPVAEAVAAANDLDVGFVLGDLRRRVTQTVFKDPALARDFRVAMTYLCLAELSGGAEGETTSRVIVEWLTGANRAVGAVKPYEIRTAINRTNARVLVESLLSWVRTAGRAGTVIVVDIARLALARNPHDERVFYARAALLDAYEVLRQFVDSTDRLEGCLMVIVAEASFAEIEPGSRGMAAYEALMFRVYDEVRDAVLANPMASLIRLTPPAPTPAALDTAPA